MDAINTAKYNLRLACGLSELEPTDQQLRLISSEVKRRLDAGKHPSDSDIKAIVAKHCPSFGQYKYAAANPSNLTDAIRAAMQALGIN